MRRRRLFANAGFSPGSLGSSLLFHIDAGNLGTLFTDTGFTTPVTAPGQSVAGFRDRGTGANHLTQSTAGSRPTWNADGTLSFDGTDDFLDHVGTTGLPNSTTEGQIYALVKQDAVAPADSTVRFVMSYGGGSAATRRSMGRTVVSNVSRATCQIGNNTTNVNANDTGTVCEGTRVLRGGAVSGNATISIDDSVPITNPVSVNTGTTRIRIGNGTSSTSHWLGKIAIVIVTPVLSAANQALLMAYLMEKKNRIS